MSSVLRTACDSCHARKSRCVSEGGDICQLCRQRGLTCVFSPRNTMGRPPRQSSPSSPYQCTSWELQLDAPCQPSYSGNGISSISPPLSHAPSSTWQLTDWPLESIGTFQPPGYEATFVADPSLPTPFLSNAASDLAILDTAMQNQESLPEQHFAEASGSQVRRFRHQDITPMVRPRPKAVWDPHTQSDTRCCFNYIHRSHRTC